MFARSPVSSNKLCGATISGFCEAPAYSPANIVVGLSTTPPLAKRGIAISLKLKPNVLPPIPWYPFWYIPM